MYTCPSLKKKKSEQRKVEDKIPHPFIYFFCKICSIKILPLSPLFYSSSIFSYVLSVLLPLGLFLPTLPLTVQIPFVGSVSHREAFLCRQLCQARLAAPLVPSCGSRRSLHVPALGLFRGGLTLGEQIPARKPNNFEHYQDSVEILPSNSKDIPRE